MTVENSDTVDRSIISGVGPYTYSFRIFDESELVVHVDIGGVDPLPLSLSTHYTVSGVNNEDGGTVTLTAAAAASYAGDTLDIRSNTRHYQPTSIRNQGSFLPEIHEDAFDRMVRQVQDLSRRVDSKLGYPDNTSLNASMVLRATWANKWVYVNSSGEFEPASAISPQALSASVIGALLYNRTAAEIAASVIPSSYGYPVGDVRRYGAIGDGTTNDAAAIESAILVAAIDGGEVFFPPGDYLVLEGNSGIEITSKSRIHLRGSRATLRRATQGTNVNYAIFTFNACTDLIVDGLNFDIHGLLYFGGAIKCYGGQRITIRDCYFYDSTPGAVTSDRYHVLFTHDTTYGLCEYVSVRGCTLDGGQLEANANHIKIEGNTFLNAINRAITCATNGNNRTFRHVHIRGNTFKNTKDAFIGIAVDPTTDTGTLIEYVVIDGNTFEASADGASEAISITNTGATNNMRNFVIANNVMQDAIGQGFLSLNIGGNTMTGVQVTGNVYRALTTSVNRPYFFQFIEEAIVARNIAYGSVITRAFYFTQFKRCTIVDNMAEASVQAYEITLPTNSTTGVNEFRNNKVLGTPTTTFSAADTNASDIWNAASNEIKALTVSGTSFRRDGFHTVRVTAAGATSINTIAGGSKGDEITVLFGDGNVTLEDGSGNIVLAGNMAGTVNDTIRLKFDGTNWFELSRSAN